MDRNMGNKFNDYLIWGVLILFLLGVIYFVASPIIWWTEKSEARLYIRIFLLMFAVNTFATLRLYNSIVQNTRFSFKLRETMQKFMTALPGLERALKSVSGSMGNARASMDALKKETVDNTDKVQRLTEKIHKLK